MTEHHHHIITKNHPDDELLSNLTKTQKRFLVMICVSIALLFGYFFSWALGRAWDYDVYIHSDEFFSQQEEYKGEIERLNQIQEHKRNAKSI